MITYQDGITNRTLSFVLDNMHRLGKIEKISHERNKEKVYYKTTIEGYEDTMVITSGLGSGYGGEGPSGLYKLLIKVGVPEVEAENLVYENTDDKHKFSIEF